MTLPCRPRAAARSERVHAIEWRRRTTRTRRPSRRELLISTMTRRLSTRSCATIPQWRARATTTRRRIHVEQNRALNDGAPRADDAGQGRRGAARRRETHGVATRRATHSPCWSRTFSLRAERAAPGGKGRRGHRGRDDDDDDDAEEESSLALRRELPPPPPNRAQDGGGASSSSSQVAATSRSAALKPSARRVGIAFRARPLESNDDEGAATAAAACALAPAFLPLPETAEQAPLGPSADAVPSRRPPTRERARQGAPPPCDPSTIICHNRTGGGASDESAASGSADAGVRRKGGGRAAAAALMTPASRFRAALPLPTRRQCAVPMRSRLDGLGAAPREAALAPAPPPRGTRTPACSWRRTTLAGRARRP